MSSLEHGIILLKPDGVKMNLERKLYDHLKKIHLDIVAINKTKLSPQEVTKYIRTSFNVKQYADYMCSGPIIAVMVKGDYAIDKLIHIKREIRTALGVTCNDMKNYIHSADLGNEHYIQTKYLFPNLDEFYCGLYADMNVLVSFDNLCSQIYNIEKKSSVSYIGLLIDADKLLSFYDKMNSIHCNKLRILYGVRFSCKIKCKSNVWKNINIIGYFINIELLLLQDFQNIIDAKTYIEIIHECKGISILDYTVYNNQIEETLTYLKTLGLDGVVVYDLRYSLQEVAKLEYISADILGLLLTGGSNGQTNNGSLSIDKKTFDLLIDKIKDYQY